MYAIGIDVSKLKSTVAVIKDGETFIKPFTITHDEEGIKILLSKLNNIDKKDIKIVMEATGIYHLCLLLKLIEFNFFVCVENAFVLKKYCDVNLRKVKTDKLDSIKIAKYCFEKWHSLKAFTLQDSAYQELQFLSRQYNQFISLKVKAKIQLSNLIEVVFPNFNSCFSDSQYLFMLEVLEKFYHPSLIKKLSETAFVTKIERMTKKRGLRTGERIGHQLYSIAQNTLSARPLNISTKLVIKNCIENIRGIEKSTEEILSQMDEIASTLPEFNIVNSMSGVGKKLRARIIGEIGDIRKFNTSNSLIAYAGIDAPPYQSGNFSAKERHITKRGNKHLRKCGYEIVKSIKSSKPSKDTTVYDFIIKKELEGKPAKVCKIAGLNKFLRIYYGRVKELYKNL